MDDRYYIKVMTPGPRRWGIWDVEESTWYDGEFPTAQYAAGVPYWRTERGAREALAVLNRKA